MRIREHDNLDRLQAVFLDIARKAPDAMRSTVRTSLRDGNTIAKEFARQTSGTHARKYPGAFSAAMLPSQAGFGSTIVRGEYGPVGRGQGLLAPLLERGSRNNKAHLNLDRSADLIGRYFGIAVDEMVDELFRPFGRG